VFPVFIVMTSKNGQGDNRQWPATAQAGANRRQPDSGG